VEYISWLLLGTFYGLFIGLVPVAGATTGLVAVFSFIQVFQSSDPYLGIVFTTALVAASAIGDSFASVILNIPGANGSAATMVDGFPLARRGRSAYALSAAITTSTVNGLLWGVLVFFFLPYYAKFIMFLGIPEMWALMLLAMSCMVFVSSSYWIRAILALALGIFLGLVGTDPNTNAQRFTGGWFYLADGIQLVVLLSGLLAFPELIEGLKKQSTSIKLDQRTQWKQIWLGMLDSWRYKWLGFKGGIIGAIVGALPGLSGSIADWLAYAQTVATNRNEKIPFGQGNIKGVIGCEGANNSHKATAYLPTVLFGIPGAPFAAVLIGLFMFLGFEMGSVSLLDDQKFFNSLIYGYFWALIIAFPIALLGIRWLTLVTVMPFQYFFWPILAIIVWACVQYTGGWEDYLVLTIACISGLILKKIKFSRPSLIIGFVLSDQIEALTGQMISLYTIEQLLSRPIMIAILTLCLGALIYGVFFQKSRISYT
jgi:putative tricarboxylic transport membrane protein